jgi:hypothetical protein
MLYSIYVGAGAQAPSSHYVLVAYFVVLYVG